MTALMGPSGAGKTTLMKCINGKIKRGMGDNTQIYLSTLRRIKSSSIAQNVFEHWLTGLTAIQSLIYASKLKNTGLIVDHEKNARDLLSELMISDIENTSVERCSGGEQKRLVIALELTSVEKPNVMFIDEPTSGLDSNAAEIVIQCLKIVSEQHNIAIMTSLHQPNNDLVKLFDNLYILGKPGICVYSGPPKHLEFHLNQTEIYCNQNQIPVEVVIRNCSKSEQSCQRLAQLMLNKRKEVLLRCHTEAFLSKDGIVPHKVGFNLRHFWYLLLRILTCTYQSQWKAIIIQITLYISLALVITQLFNSKVGEPSGCLVLNNQSNICFATNDLLLLIQSQKLQFIIGMTIQFLMTVGAVLLFTKEIKVFYSEHQNGWYSSGSFYWAKTIFELPLCLIIILIYTLILYNLTNQIDDLDRFLGYLAVITLGVLCSQGLGMTIGILANSNERLASVLTVGCFIYNILLCGFFAPLSELPGSFRWISHLAFPKQTNEMLLTILYGFGRCPKGQTSYMLCSMELTGDEIWTNAWIICLNLLIYRCLPLSILMFKVNRHRLNKLFRFKCLGKFKFTNKWRKNTYKVNYNINGLNTV